MSQAGTAGFPPDLFIPDHHGAQFVQLSQPDACIPHSNPKNTKRKAQPKWRRGHMQYLQRYTKMSFQFTVSQIQSLVIGDNFLFCLLRTVNKDQCHSLVACSIHPSTGNSLKHQMLFATSALDIFPAGVSSLPMKTDTHSHLTTN